jgi:hypothetical protein
LNLPSFEEKRKEYEYEFYKWKHRSSNSVRKRISK